MSPDTDKGALGDFPFRRATTRALCNQAFAERQAAIVGWAAVNLAVDGGIELRLIPVAQIQAHRFGLAKAGGQIEPVISLRQRQRFELLQHPLCRATATQIAPRPDALQLGGLCVIAFKGAHGDRRTGAQQHDEGPLRRRVQIQRFRFPVTKIVAVTPAIFAEQPLDYRGDQRVGRQRLNEGVLRHRALLIARSRAG